MDEVLSSGQNFYSGSLLRVGGYLCALCLLAGADAWLMPICGQAIVWFSINALVIALFVVWTTRHYGTVLNPVAFFGGYYAMATVIAPAVYSSLGLFADLDDASVTHASILSSIYFAALGSAFLLNTSPIGLLFEWLFRRTVAMHITGNRGNSASRFLLFQFVLLFALLMTTSGVGFMWLTNSREAYQFHRGSVGVVWSLCQATLLLAYICRLFGKVRNLWTLTLTSLLFAGVALFLGSKSSTLTYFVLALFYADLRIKRVPAQTVLIVGGALLVGALTLQLQQGTAQGLLDTLVYFDYFRNSAALLDRFSDFGFHHGSITLSYLWNYVPRAAYSSKPFVYGQIQATEFLFPGMAESIGATPGLMDWTAGYGDFGFFGVMVAGLFSGLVSKAAYELLIARKDIMSTALFAQLGLIYYVELFRNAPFIVFILWIVFQMICVRYVQWLWTSREPQAAD